METALRLFAPRSWWIVCLAVALPSCIAESGRPSPDRVPPPRIVSLLPATTEILDALGAEDEHRRARQVGLSAGSPRVAWLVWHDPPILTGRGTFIDEVRSAAGGDMGRTEFRGAAHACA